MFALNCLVEVDSSRVVKRRCKRRRFSFLAKILVIRQRRPCAIANFASMHPAFDPYFTPYLDPSVLAQRYAELARSLHRTPLVQSQPKCLVWGRTSF